MILLLFSGTKSVLNLNMQTLAGNNMHKSTITTTEYVHKWRPVKTVKTPRTVTHSQHQRLHIAFQSWSPYAF